MADEIISRAVARARGLSKYFTGKPCKYGHVAQRRTANGLCIECQTAIEARWRANNPESFRAKVRRQAARHRRENPDRIRFNQKRWADANKDKIYKKGQIWAEANREKRREYDKRGYYRDIEKARAKNRKKHASLKDDPNYRQKALDRMRRWEAENPERAKANRRKVRQTRRARQYEAGGSYTNAEINALVENQHWLCAEVTCRADLREGKELDHYIPISKGGRNDIGNLQWLCVPCNRQKRDMMPDEWVKHRQQQREKGKIP